MKYKHSALIIESKHFIVLLLSTVQYQLQTGILTYYRCTNTIYFTIKHHKYTVSQKNDNDVLRYNFNAHQLILIIFGRDIAE